MLNPEYSAFICAGPTGMGVRKIHADKGIAANFATDGPGLTTIIRLVNDRRAFKISGLRVKKFYHIY